MLRRLPFAMVLAAGEEVATLDIGLAIGLAIGPASIRTTTSTPGTRTQVGGPRTSQCTTGGITRTGTTTVRGGAGGGGPTHK